MDPDIPVVSAIAINSSTEEKIVTQRLGIINGRSSRVSFPIRKSYKLLDIDIQTLQDQGFTRGLAEALTKNILAFPLRIWVVDNSGSMTIRDGHRIVESSKKDNVKLVDCTRWSEIQQTVEYHAQMSALLRAPTVFRLLNDPGKISGPQQFSVGERDDTTNEDLTIALKTIRNTSPEGVTPLSGHLQEIRSNIVLMEPKLRENGSKVVVVIATDGLPSDSQGSCDESTKEEFIQNLRSLEGLPIWIVVRLCTDDESVVEFYNDLDDNLELSLEVIDDFTQEAQEVHVHNKWLNYALPLHRCREMGYHTHLFDLLDERQLSADELREFLNILFGPEKCNGVPDPQVEWDGFVKIIKSIVEEEKYQWNPITRKMAPWVDIKKLNRAYKQRCTIM